MRIGPLLRSRAIEFGLVSAGLLIASCVPTPHDDKQASQSGSELGGDTGAGGVAGSGGAIAGSGGTSSIVGGTTGDSGETSPSTGGTSSGGAASANGGSTAPTGGAPASGGATASSGGVLSGAGGTASSGGASAGSGGRPGTGGSSGGSAGSGIRPMTCAPLDAPNTCGDGRVDPGEQCDGSDVRGLTCTALDPFFTGGTLSCVSNCTLDTSKCMHGTCGNGVVDPGEDCEYPAYSPISCNGIVPGENDYALAGCSISTCRYDLSTCSMAPTPVCGNGVRDGGEQCDGDDWLWRSCVEPGALTYTGGQLHCNQATCELDYTQCTRCDGSRCGDGTIDPVEQCDGANLGTHSCADQNRLFGTVSCLPNCNVDYSKCPGCTIFKGRLICN